MLFAAVSMGFIAENIREKYTENERSEELMQAFIMDVKENQKQLESLIVNNKRISYYYDSLTFDHGFGKKKVELKRLSEMIDLVVYRFNNKKIIFEQMKNTGALRYIKDKEILNAMLRYEESASLVEIRSMENETNQYNNEFRPAISEILPLSFFEYISDNDLKNISRIDSTVNPWRYKNYKIYSSEIKKELENTILTNLQMKLLAKAWYRRQERIWISLKFQIQLEEKGDELLKLIETKYHQ
jgi:hypothetical protein